MKNKDLSDFIRQTQTEIQDDYLRLKRRAPEDPGTAGDQVEKNWAKIFEDWLSPTFQVVTKGRIMSYSGEASPQIDILILKPEYPKKLISKELFLVEGVLAAFECKMTLEKRGIEKTIETSKKIKKLVTNLDRKGSPYFELQSSIMYGLLANSHSWTGDENKKIRTVSNRLYELDKKIIEHPIEMLDLLCIADLGTWSASKWPISPAVLEGEKNVSETYYTVFANSINSSKSKEVVFTPVGSLISQLTRKIAREYSGIQWLALHYQLSRMSGTGIGRGQYMRQWGFNIYSDQIRGRINNKFIDNKMWGEWNFCFD